jgi:hypothetical protein
MTVCNFMAHAEAEIVRTGEKALRANLSPLAVGRPAGCNKRRKVTRQ